MNSYLRVEIDGNAQNCAYLINQLLNTYNDLRIDQQGFLLIPASQWDELQEIAVASQCRLVPAERNREAA